MRTRRGSQIADEIMSEYYRKLYWKEKLKAIEEEKAKKQKNISDTR